MFDFPGIFSSNFMVGSFKVLIKLSEKLSLTTYHFTAPHVVILRLISMKTWHTKLQQPFRLKLEKLILNGEACRKEGMLPLRMQTVARDPGRIWPHGLAPNRWVHYVATAEERPGPLVPLVKRHTASAVNCLWLNDEIQRRGSGGGGGWQGSRGWK